MTNKPEIFTLDLIGDNGTPFRFMYWPEQGEIRYYDRRYPTTPDKPGYGINHFNENGQACGGPLLDTDFTPLADYGIRGWHEVDAWDIDRDTRRIVGKWITALKERAS